MVIYVLYYALVGISALSVPNVLPKEQLINQKTKKARNIWCFILFLGLFLIMALRHPSMGVDLQYGNSTGYLGRFQFISNQSWSFIWNNGVQGYEKGYVFFNKLISCVSNEVQWYLIACSLISLCPIFVIYNRYSDNVPVSLCVYMGLTCYSAVFSAMRQSIAIGICFLSFIFIKNKKIIPFVLLVLLAFSFHSSAIVFLLAYPAYWIKIRKNIRVVTLLAIGGIFLFRSQLFTIFSRILKDNAVMDYNGAIVYFLVLLMIYIFCFIFGEDDKETGGLLNLLLIAVICQLFGNVHSYVTRLGYYFMPFLGLLIPRVFYSSKLIETKTKKILEIVVVIAFVAFGLYNLYVGKDSWTKSYPWLPFWK